MGLVVYHSLGVYPGQDLLQRFRVHAAFKVDELDDRVDVDHHRCGDAFGGRLVGHVLIIVHFPVHAGAAEFRQLRGPRIRGFRHRLHLHALIDYFQFIPHSFHTTKPERKHSTLTNIKISAAVTVLHLLYGHENS